MIAVIDQDHLVPGDMRRRLIIQRQADPVRFFMALRMPDRQQLGLT